MVVSQFLSGASWPIRQSWSAWTTTTTTKTFITRKFAEAANARYSRYIAVTRGNILVVNVYLPSNDNSKECRSALIDILCSISEIINQHSRYDVMVAECG